MSNLPEQKVGKRRISNLPSNQTAENTTEKNQNNENNKDIQLTIKNGPDYQIKVNNLEQLPSPLSNEPIISTPNPNQAPQTKINNQNINTPIQFQQVPGVNPALITNQINPQQPKVIIIRQVSTVPSLIYNYRYTPASLTCPYCTKNVVSNPYSYWSCISCDACCVITLLSLISLGLYLFCDLCCIACRDEDFCCCEADHKCPHCNNIIGKRSLNRRRRC